MSYFGGFLGAAIAVPVPLPPSTIYGDLKLVADDLLTQFSQGTVTLAVPGAETPGANPWDPPTTGAPTELTLSAAVRGIPQFYVNGTTIQTGDLWVTCKVSASPPEVGLALTIDGVGYMILAVEPKPAAGTVVAYRLHVRK